ncbi:MAG TPA: hypothetical protein VLA66_14140 [Thermoanaerobaculia bacterium]|nr:hypothetical protein [Thermoanaerobaculia bacterium]
MFAGHFGAGFGAKAAAPRLSLGTLFLAAQFVDLLWPTLLLLGLEQVEIRPGITRVTPLDFVSYPISHSLAMGVVWGLVLGGIVRALGRTTRSAVVVGLAVASHWLLDLIVHRPDLPLAPGLATKVGLGLWGSLPATLAVELVILGAGVAVYLRATRARDRAGTIGLWSLVACLLAIELSNLLGPPPPSVTAIAVVGQAQWLLVAWGYWIDRHREVRAGAGR